MQQIARSALPTVPQNSLSKRESTSVKRALSDRLFLSEALDAVSKMLSGYPNRPSGDSYIGAMAALLMRYPRSVALRCADPFNGVARETKFLPTPADVIGWCERATAPMHEEAAREDRIDAQLAAREEWQSEEKNPSLLAKCAAWLDRTDPHAKRMIEGTPEDQAARAAREQRHQENMEQHRERIAGQWGDTPPPTIAGVPVSKELAAKMGIPHGHVEDHQGQ